MKTSFAERQHEDSEDDNNHNKEDEENSHSENDDGMNENSGFPTTAAGAFDDDALGNVAAGVTYGATFYPTDDDFLPRTGAGTALDRRLWQQVLDLHAAAQQPEPLHELAILAEQQPDLLGFPPMGTDAANEAVDHTIGPPMALAAAMTHLNNVPQPQQNQHQDQNNDNSNHQTAVAAFQPLQDRKRSAAENSYQQPNSHSFRTRLPKKRRLSLPQPLSNARKQMNQATLARRMAYNHLHETEHEYNRWKQRFEAAQSDYDKASETLQNTAQIFIDDLLQEDTTWNANYRLLRNYYRKHGHTNIPRRAPTEEQLQEDPHLAKLGRWVGDQRREYRLPLDNPDRLEEYKILALQRLNFDFDPLHNMWHRQYNRLKQFYKKHGHTKVPYRPANDGPGSDEDDEDMDGQRSLGSWVKRQRYQYKLYQDENPASDMTPERIQLLEKLNFAWQIRGNAIWEDYFQELKEYYKQHSHTLVPCSRKTLYEWTQEQRQQCRVYDEDPSRSELTGEQVRRLKELGLSEDLREGKWYRRFHELLLFQRQHGHCIVPTYYPFNQALVNWCSTQRRQYKMLTQGKRSQLTPERIEMLEKAGFVWEVSTQQRADAQLNKTWDELYAECALHREEFGSLDGIVKDSELYRWCQEQQKHYRRLKHGQSTPLSSEKKERLDQLGFSLNGTDDSIDTQSTWESLYNDLLIFRLNHGSFNVPMKLKELHQFVQEQRCEYAKLKQEFPSKLSSDRISKLNAVKFPWKAAKVSTTKSWEEMLGELLAFRLQNNSFDVPKHLDEDLYKWVQDQRRMYHTFDSHAPESDQRSLAEKRIEKLEGINFPF